MIQDRKFYLNTRVPCTPIIVFEKVSKVHTFCELCMSANKLVRGNDHTCTLHLHPFPTMALQTLRRVVAGNECARFDLIRFVIMA